MQLNQIYHAVKDDVHQAKNNHLIIAQKSDLIDVRKSTRTRVSFF